ncbi:MAG: hypothetical protein HDR03_09380 [Lachnospiraceae bacterium]|nr:hypothetical protein [Lachnospiraceae bacterium]
MNKTSIEVVAEMIKWEADEYRKKFDGIKSARERELKEANDTYKPGCKALLDKIEQINNTCDSALTRLKVEAADRALKDVEALREQELERVQTINEPLLAKIRAIENIPMTTLELKAFSAKIGAKGDYWASRALADVAEKNGIDSTEIGIESTYDTKMNILDQLTDQLNSVFKYYGTKDVSERTKVKFLYLNDDIIERAKQIYGGKISKLSDSQKADRAYFTVRTQPTDIGKGVAIANVLRNAKGEVRNMILCRLAEDKTVSSMAAEFSGRLEEIESFRNGLAAEYRAAERALQNIRNTKDKTIIEQTAAGLEENTFFGDMYAKEQKTNIVLYETLHGEKVQSESATE